MDSNYTPYLDDRMNSMVTSTADMKRAKAAMKLKSAQEKYEKAMRKYSKPYYDTGGTGIPMPGAVITPKMYKKIMKKTMKARGGATYIAHQGGTFSGDGIAARGISARGGHVFIDHNDGTLVGYDKEKLHKQVAASGITARGAGPLISIIGALAKPLISKGIQALAKKIKARRLKRKAMAEAVVPESTTGEGLWSAAAKTAMKVLERKYGDAGRKHLKTQLKAALGKEYAGKLLGTIAPGPPATTYKDLVAPLLKAKLSGEEGEGFFTPKGWSKPIRGKGLRDKLKNLFKKGISFVKSTVAPIAIKGIAGLIKTKVDPSIGSMIDNVAEKATDLVTSKKKTARSIENTAEEIEEEAPPKPKKFPKTKKDKEAEEAVSLEPAAEVETKPPLSGDGTKRNKALTRTVYAGGIGSSADAVGDELLAVPVYKLAKNTDSKS